MTNSLLVVVQGAPAPQGSKRHVGGGRMVEQSTRLRPWRALVTAATVDALAGAQWAPERGTPIHLAATFTLARPSSHYRSGRHAAELKPAAPEHPTARPDIDKLLRSTLDALTDAGALVDDARVVTVEAVKAYPGGALDALDTPGAVIVLREW